jgi:hypothetical protein
VRIRIDVTIDRRRDDVFHRLAQEIDRTMPLGRQTDPAKAYRRSMVRLVLIACGLAVLLGAAFATYQAFTL